MKIKVNYDLIEKIKEAKTGIRLHRIVKDKLKVVGLTLGITSPFYAFSSLRSNLLNILYVFLLNASFGGLEYFFEKRFKDSIELNATLELICLANDLSNLDVKTTTELLKDSEVIQTNYKIKFRDSDKLPVLKQEKYIEIPLCNGYTETLLQEHNIGSKNYELSVQEPTKKMRLKLSKTTQ